MQKLACFKNQKELHKPQRFVFMAVEKPSGEAPKPTTGFHLKEEFEHENNTNLNVEVGYTENFDEVFKKLGAEAQKTNPELSAESIKQNFTETLQQGKTIEEAWDFLKSKDCKTAAILGGLLRFFAGPKGTKEISLAEFYKPLEGKIGGEGTLTHKYLEMRQKFLSESMQQLQAQGGFA